MTESRPDPRVEPLARLLHDDTCIDRPPFYCCRLRARDLLAAIDASEDIALVRMGVEYPIARRLRVREAGAARGGSTRRSPYR